jgi:PKD repeat protein
MSAQLKGGYWDQNIRNPGSFLPRNGGRPYTNAWGLAINARANLRRVYLESWNEYDEGSGMYAANPGPPYILPGSGNTNTDVWSLSNDPYEYIKTTARGAALFNDWPDHDTAIVWHNIPTNMQPGEVRNATVIVRNEGDALWSEAAKYRFSQSDSDAVDFGQGRYLIDDTQDDIPTFGGIFRGRTKTFQITLTAPTQPGTYLTHWGMLQENVEWFGQQISQNIEIPPLTVTATATPTNGGAPFTVQFTGQASGGRSSVTTVDTTDDHLGTVTAAGENNGINGNWEVATNVFDDITGTKWLDFATNYPSTRQSWIQYQYANGQCCLVIQYTITSANDAASYPERNPADWRLLGSNNGGASWVTLDIQTNQVFTANFQKLAYSFTNTAAYNLYRFQIDRVANPAQAVAMQLDELEFLFVPSPYSYSWCFGDGTTSTNQNPQHTYLANGIYTATLVVSDGFSKATNSTTIWLAPPVLAVSITTVGQLSLSWPAWATNYTLYSTTDLAPPVLWSPVTNAAALIGDFDLVTLPFGSTDQRFLRLQRSVNSGQAIMGAGASP